MSNFLCSSFLDEFDRNKDPWEGFYYEQRAPVTIPYISVPSTPCLGFSLDLTPPSFPLPSNTSFPAFLEIKDIKLPYRPEDHVHDPVPPVSTCEDRQWTEKARENAMAAETVNMTSRHTPIRLADVFKEGTRKNPSFYYKIDVGKLEK